MVEHPLEAAQGAAGAVALGLAGAQQVLLELGEAVLEQVAAGVAAGVLLAAVLARLAAARRLGQLLLRQGPQLDADRAELVLQRLHLVVELELAQRARRRGGRAARSDSVRRSHRLRMVL